MVIARMSAPDVAAGRRGIYKLGQLYYGESKGESLEEKRDGSDELAGSGIRVYAWMKRIIWRDME